MWSWKYKVCEVGFNCLANKDQQSCQQELGTCHAQFDCYPESPIHELPWTAFHRVRKFKWSVFWSFILLSSTNVYKPYLVSFRQNAVVINSKRSNAHLILAEKYLANKWYTFQEITEMSPGQFLTFREKLFFLFTITTNIFNVQFHAVAWFIAFTRLIVS